MSMVRTKRGALRRYNAILRSYLRDFADGGMFGFDWPTLRLNSPERYAQLVHLKTIYRSLPE